MMKFNNTRLIAFLIILCSFMASKYLIANDEAVSFTPSGTWQLYSKGNLGVLSIQNQKYTFSPSSSWVMDTSRGGKPYFFVVNTCGKIECSSKDNNKLYCIVNKKDRIEIIKESDCESIIVHENAELPWVSMDSCSGSE